MMCELSSLSYTHWPNIITTNTIIYFLLYVCTNKWDSESCNDVQARLLFLFALLMALDSSNQEPQSEAKTGWQRPLTLIIDFAVHIAPVSLCWSWRLSAKDNPFDGLSLSQQFFC
jgi:hypothetical protein